MKRSELKNLVKEVIEENFLDRLTKGVNVFGTTVFGDKPLLPSALKAYQDNWDTNKIKGISWERWSAAVKDKFGITDKDLAQIKR